MKIYILEYAASPIGNVYFWVLSLSEFVVAMKSLGYPHTISLEDFCSPNFKLVADCLTWLMLR
jgi:hypothetical protein